MKENNIDPTKDCLEDFVTKFNESSRQCTRRCFGVFDIDYSSKELQRNINDRCKKVIEIEIMSFFNLEKRKVVTGGTFHYEYVPRETSPDVNTAVKIINKVNRL